MSVTATNFQDAPHSAWGFHHVPDLLPVATVARGDGPVWELPRRDAGLGALAVPLAGGRSATLGELDAAGDVDGIAVLHRGRLVHEAYGNGMAPADSHILMSTTKSFTGTLAAALDNGMAMPDALRAASVAGALACLEHGAMPSLPDADAIDARLDELAPAEAFSF